MKIFSQSTACALIAVANAGARADVSTNANHHVYLRDTSLLGYFPDQATAQQPIAPFTSTNGQLSCVGVPRRSRDKNIVHCTYELYGGWDLPVPPPTSELESEEPACFMGHLPRRGEKGKMERIDCSSNEIIAFGNGYGPTGFTGFVSMMHVYVIPGLSGIPRVISDDKCWLVANGKLTPILENCHNAVENTEPDRHVVEDLSASNEIERFPDEYYY